MALKLYGPRVTVLPRAEKSWKYTALYISIQKPKKKKTKKQKLRGRFTQPMLLPQGLANP